MITFLIVTGSQVAVFVRVIRFKRERRVQMTAINLRSINRARNLASRDMSTNAGNISIATFEQENVEQTVSTSQVHWDSFLDNVRAAFTVFLVCSTYIIAFIFGAALGTGLTMAYQEELKSCKIFTDLNLYAWTVVITMYMLCFAANPYIYGLRNNDLKNEFKAMLCFLNSTTRFH